MNTPGKTGRQVFWSIVIKREGVFEKGEFIAFVSGGEAQSRISGKATKHEKNQPKCGTFSHDNFRETFSRVSHTKIFENMFTGLDENAIMDATTKRYK